MSNFHHIAAPQRFAQPHTSWTPVRPWLVDAAQHSAGDVCAKGFGVNSPAGAVSRGDPAP